MADSLVVIASVEFNGMGSNVQLSDGSFMWSLACSNQAC